MDIDLSTLLIFRKIVESGSFTEAGRYWNIPQPNVSAIISRLESDVGLVLFERLPAGVRLTSAGTQFLDWSNGVCDAYLVFSDGIKTLSRRIDHEILIGIDRSSTASLLRKTLERRHPVPGVSFRFCDIGSAWWQELSASKFDIVIAGRFLQAGLTPHIQEAVMGRERGITVAWNNDFYAIDAARFNFPDALRNTILIPDNHVVSGFSEFLEFWCDYAYGFRPANVIPFSTEIEAATAAAAGLGIFLGPGDSIPRLEPFIAGLTHVRTFEFLLPDAYTFGVYCRGDEESNEILTAAASIGKLGTKLTCLQS